MNSKVHSNCLFLFPLFAAVLLLSIGCNGSKNPVERLAGLLQQSDSLILVAVPDSSPIVLADNSVFPTSERAAFEQPKATKLCSLDVDLGLSGIVIADTVMSFSRVGGGKFRARPVRNIAARSVITDAQLQPGEYYRQAFVGGRLLRDRGQIAILNREEDQRPRPVATYSASDHFVSFPSPNSMVIYHRNGDEVTQAASFSTLNRSLTAQVIYDSIRIVEFR